MVQIAIAPIVLTNVLFTVATDDYAKHVSRVEFVPSTSPVTWKGLNPTANSTKTPTATWVCNLEYAQDWETADSLSQYLHDNEGEEVVVVFEPELAGATWTATVQITPGSIGGAVDAFATATVTLGVTGKPALTPAA